VQTPVALTIAGSDPSGGAGIQADLKTFHQFGVYGEAVVTLVTVQNTRGVHRVEVLDPDLVIQQIRAVLDDIPPQAAKAGALGNHAVAEALSRMAGDFDFPLVVDPVMISKHGADLAGRSTPAIRSYLITPNLYEAGVLAGFSVADLESVRRAARKIHESGAANVLIKGGHLSGEAVDVLYTSSGEFHEFATPRIETAHTHGTGCTHSAAITAELAKGTALLTAVERAKAFITEAIRTSPGLGGGCGPLNHFAKPRG
jgi:hydroxymethylpyrimidine/phosphomethylpyrimidine kinase